jgi:hypothetical protein
MFNLLQLPNFGKTDGVPCEGTVKMRVGLSLTVTDTVSKPLKDAGEVTSWC